MRLLKITTLLPPANLQKLGIVLKSDEMTPVDKVIFLEHVTDFNQHPDDNNLTLIHLVSGRTLIGNITIDNFTYIIEDMI